MNVTEAEGRLGIPFPEALRTLYSSGDGRYREDGQWWVVWPLDHVVVANLAAWRDGTLAAELLAFGDDGTGNPFCMDAIGDDPTVVREAVTGLDLVTLAKASRLELLDSALHAPLAGFGDEDFYPDLAQKAAVLVVRIARNHPLSDGNKRLA